MPSTSDSVVFGHRPGADASARRRAPTNLLAVIVIALSACAGDRDARLAVIEPTLVTTPEGYRVIRGAVENAGGRAAAPVTVHVEFVDSAGAVIGTDSASAATVAPGARWFFQVVVKDTNTRTFRTNATSP